MKKIVSFLLAFACLFSVFAVAACGEKPDEPTEPTDQMVLNLRTPDTYDMLMGETYKIVYAVKGSDKGVTFSSSDPEVIKIDDFGNVEALKPGQATVTVALKEDASVKKTVVFSVTKSFFYDKTGYKNGMFDLSTQDDGYIEITGDQTQVLVSEYSETWYFKCDIEHSGQYTNSDSSGRFGVGSFNVTDDTPIGQVMAWFGFIPKMHRKHTYIPYVGGWRVKSGDMDPDVTLNNGAAMDLTDGATLELIRYGTMHYYKVTAGGETVKYAYDCPAFEGVPTYPGVFSQNQIITVYNYEASSDAEEVLEKLNNFQIAEQVVINGITDELIAGETYDLSATVLPQTTFNKNVTWSVEKSMQGVSLTPEGKLTVSAGITGEVTVVATSASDPSVTARKTYTVIAKPASESQTIETGLILAEEGNITNIGENEFTVTEGENYIPLNAYAQSWAVSFTVKGSATAGKLGVASVTNGYMQIAQFNLLRTTSQVRYMEYGVADALNTFAYAADGSSTASETLTLVKKEADYYVFVGGRLVKKLTVGTEGDTRPVIYTKGLAATFTNVSVSTDATEIGALLAEHPFAVGAYVAENGGGSYTLAAKDFGSSGNINWPPVNDYANGLKSTTTFTTDFTVSFTLSDIQPIVQNGKYDSKILVYLRSESKTASLQFVIKGTPSAPEVYFCPNLDDATWTEYPMPEGVDLLNGSTRFAIVRQGNWAAVYINGERAFAQTAGMSNDKWEYATKFTPGIGTFLASAKVANVSFQEGIHYEENI